MFCEPHLGVMRNNEGSALRDGGLQSLQAAIGASTSRSALAWGTKLLDVTLRVQVPNNHILTQNQYYNYYYPKPKYLIIGYMDPLGN